MSAAAFDSVETCGRRCRLSGSIRLSTGLIGRQPARSRVPGSGDRTGGRGRITEVQPLGAQALDLILDRRSVGGIRDTGAGDSMTSATRCEGIETAETMQDIIETAAEPAKLHDVVNAALEERPSLGAAFGTIVEPEQESAGPDPG
jgi:hypothetical protein